MGFSREEYWSWLPFSSPGHLPNTGIEPGSPALLADSLLTELQGKPMIKSRWYIKSKDITLLTKVCLVKAMAFPVVIYGYESWTIKKAECWRIDAFELWCWRRLLRVCWTARRSNQSNLKEISPEYSLKKGLMMKLKLQYFGHLMQRVNHWKRPWCWERFKAGEWNNREGDAWMASLTDGHEFEQAPRVGDGQGSLVCFSQWGRQDLDTTERLNWSEAFNI